MSPVPTFTSNEVLVILCGLVRVRRKALGLTQQELVDVAPFGTTFISDLENGKETAQLNKAIETIRMLGLRLIIESPDDESIAKQ
jgi:y4mF family transcriptional regulator